MSVSSAFLPTNFAQIIMKHSKHPMTSSTGIDLSKILDGQTKILGGQKVVKSDKCIGVSQLLGGTCPGCPQSLHL